MTAALMYHDVVPAGAEDSSGFPGRDAALYKITPDRFRDHLTAIGHLHAPLPAITFDDGGVSAMRAADLLDASGLRGMFFITSNYVGTPGFVTTAHLRALRARGHTIGSHSCSHPLRIGHCGQDRLNAEWTRSVDALAQLLGAPVTTGSVPGGDFAPRVADAAAKAGIGLLFTSEPTRRVRHLHGLELRGRYTIYGTTTAATAAALARGARLPCARQATVWAMKKAAKRVGGEQYLRVRKLLLGHGDDVRWGDASPRPGPM